MVPPVVTNIGGNNQGGTDVPITDPTTGTNTGTNTGTTDNTNTNPSRPNEGLIGPNEGLSRDCAYWQSQGYTCNGAGSLRQGLGDRLLLAVAFAVGAFWFGAFA